MSKHEPTIQDVLDVLGDFSGNMDRRMTNIEHDMRDMKADIVEIRGDIGDIKSRLNTVEDHIQDIKKQLTRLEQKTTDDNDAAAVKEVVLLKKRIETLERVVAELQAEKSKSLV